MRRVYFFVLILAAGLMVGCASDGPSASSDQMAASRDAQAKAMAGQRSQMAAQRGAGSIDAAAKAGSKTTAGN